MSTRTTPLLALCSVLAVVGASAGPDEDPRKREPTSWEVTLASSREPGERFELSGLVLAASGAPMRGIRIFAYHADAGGSYGGRFPRLAGVLRTDSLGRYRLRTVVPGNYDGYASHVHFETADLVPAFFVVNVFQPAANPDPGQFQEPFLDMHRDADGTWRARWDLGPGARNPRVRGLTRAQALRNGPNAASTARSPRPKPAPR